MRCGCCAGTCELCNHDEGSARQYEILNRVGREWKGANDAKLGKGRSGGRAAPKKERKAKGKEKSNEEEPCICEKCMSWETYKYAERRKRLAVREARSKESSAVAE